MLDTSELQRVVSNPFTVLSFRQEVFAQGLSFVPFIGREPVTGVIGAAA
jgi:hypothetical protein